jgi:hypothetical protein
MSSRRSDRLALAVALSLSFSGASFAAEAAPQDLSRLLADSDLFAKAPEEFRAELELGTIGSNATNSLEIFRKGRELELVRFLAPKERGKFLLRREERLYFLAPGSARPVELQPSYRVHGAAISELLGLDLARDFRIARTEEAGSTVTFDLEASAAGAAAKRLRWVVDRKSARPLRADFQSAQGKTLRVVEFKAWRDAVRGVPGHLVVKDLVTGAAPLEIRFVAFEHRPIDAALFDLADGKARAALPAPTG